MKSGSRTLKLLESGVIFAAIGFLATIIHNLFQIVLSRLFVNTPGEFGLMNSTVNLIGYLGMPLAIATQAVTHYVARFHFSGDDARLHGLLAGCRKFLLHITIAGSVIAIILVKPLGDFFHLPRMALTLIVLACVLGNLWSSYITALCQGLGWFKRLALIGLLAAIARLAFGWPTAYLWPMAEWGVLASVVMVLPNLILLFWRHDFPKRTQTSISPWTPEFVQFIIVASAYTIGANIFNTGDTLVSQKYFSEANRDAYSAAEKLAVGLVTAVGPLLTVLFIHRSSRQHHHGDELWDQLKLLGLYAFGLVCGGLCLYVLRGFCLKLFHRSTPEAMAMIGRLTISMVFVGLLQAIGTWSLASRWTKISLLYGGLGLGYWAVLLALGRTPAALLQIMPLATGSAFAILFVFWIVNLRHHKTAAPVEPAG